MITYCDCKTMKETCHQCKRKLNIVEVSTCKCKCNNLYCTKHRLPENHECTYKHHENFKKELQETLIVVKEAKVAAI